MKLDDFLGRFESVKRQGSGFIARCPAHDDQNPSLSIKEEKGKILLHCHAGCTTESIVSALGLSFSDLFTSEEPESKEISRPNSSLSNSPNPAKRRDETVATYEYQNAEGMPLYRVMRTASKQFFQERWTGSKWERGLNGVKPVLFRLPELLASPLDVPIYICEGEKDVLACVEQGLAATCNSGGAGKFKPEFAEFFYGRRAVIVMDRDEAGRKHAQRISDFLDGIATSVQVVHAKSGKDAHDHFAAGFSVDEFVEMSFNEVFGERSEIETQSPGGASIEGRRTPQAMRLADIEPKVVDWLWDPYLPKGEPVLLAGDGGVGKTFITLSIIASVTAGIPLPWGEMPTTGNVLFVTAEDDLAKTVSPRAKAQGADMSKVFVFDLNDDQLGSNWFEAVLAEAKRICAVLVVLDPMQAFVTPGADLNKLSVARQEMGSIRRLARVTNACVLLITHFNKNTGGKAQYRVNGSSDLVSASRSALLAGKVEVDDSEVWIVVHGKSNYAESGPTLRYEIRDGRLNWLGTSPYTAQDISCGARSPGKREEAAEFITEILSNGPVSSKRVYREGSNAGLSKRTLDRTKKLLGIIATRNENQWFWTLNAKVAKPGSEMENIEGCQIGPSGKVGNLDPLPPFQPAFAAVQGNSESLDQEEYREEI